MTIKKEIVGGHPLSFYPHRITEEVPDLFAGCWQARHDFDNGWSLSVVYQEATRGMFPRILRGDGVKTWEVGVIDPDDNLEVFEFVDEENFSRMYQEIASKENEDRVE